MNENGNIYELYRRFIKCAGNRPVAGLLNMHIYSGDLKGNVAVKFNFLCSAYFWIPCTVQITKNIFFGFFLLYGSDKCMREVRNELFILLRFYYVIIHIRRGLRKSMRSKDT